MRGLFLILSLLPILSTWPLFADNLTVDNLIGAILILFALAWSLKRKKYNRQEPAKQSS